MTTNPETIFSLPWVPPAELRGNSRAHYQAKARIADEYTDMGVGYGREIKGASTGNVYPLQGDLEIEIYAYHPREIDYDNLLIGYKAFIDGLQVVIKKRHGVEILGAGIIENDRQIKDAIIRIRKNKESRSVIYIRPLRAGPF